MINKCDSCVHAKTCYGQNDDYADDGGLCVHYRHSSGMNNDEVVMWLKETQEHYGECHEKAYEAIEIAINRIQEPSSSKGDLISREALKEALQHRSECGPDCTGMCCVDCFCDLIDNAPTVEPFEPDYVGAERLKARQRGYEEGYHYGMRIGKTLNPQIKQGEYISVDTLFVKCSICGNLTRVLKKYNMPNFCPACGADMRKGGAENE